MRAGERIAGRYQLVERLGRGGMGEVWRGLDLELGRGVALKMVLEVDAGTEVLSRFRREAAIGAQFQHPGITVVYDIGQHENQLFIVMELLDGEDLSRLLAREPAGLPVAQAVDLAVQAARALAATHAQGVVHRDLKPANLFLLTDGRLKICDFGIARGMQATRATRTGWMLGSPPYMAPEQWRGKDVDTRTDLYALGCVLYELLTGAPPFPLAGDPSALMYQHLQEVPVPLRSTRAEVPEELETLVAALLSKEPDARPDAASTAERLQAVKTPVPSVSQTVKAEAARPAGQAPARALAPTEDAGPAPRDPAPAPGAPARSGKLRRRVILLGGTAALLSGPALSALTDGSDSTSGSGAGAAIRTGTLASTLTGTYTVYSVAFSPDGKTLASGGGDVRLWDIATGTTTATLIDHAGNVLSVAFTPDGKTLIGGGDNARSIELWSVAGGGDAAIMNDITDTGHGGSVTSVLVSPDGKTLASGGDDGAVRLWDLATHSTLATLAGHTNAVTSVAFSPDGRTLASSGDDGMVRLWKLATGSTFATLTGHTNSVSSVVFSPDGKTLASGSMDHTIRLWDLATARTTATLTGHPDSVLSVAFSPDGNTLASGSADQTIGLWDLTTHSTIARLTGHTNSVMSVAFSPDGNTLASGSDDDTVRLWRLSK